mmetsp:Transcript_10535/g.12093  ORF Transcript_10535/g.12093 Transcript_10535/m.12093 type:complete len:311 (+) Transcript_10535:75-1007(+)
MYRPRIASPRILSVFGSRYGVISNSLPCGSRFFCTEVNTNLLKSDKAIQAVKQLKHEQFFAHSADTANRIQDSLLTLSLLEDIIQKPNLSIFDVGCGSGYFTSLLVLLCRPNGARIAGIDRNQDLIDNAVQALISSTDCMGKEVQASLLDQVVLMPLDGTQSWGPNAPYDIIRTGFCFENTTCDEFVLLFQQLKIGGTFIAPIGTGREQYLKVLKKTAKDTIVDKSEDFCSPLRLLHPVGRAKSQLLVHKTEEQIEAESEKEQKLESVKTALEEWKKSFVETNGRNPNREDLKADEKIFKLFQEFSRLNT